MMIFELPSNRTRLPPCVMMENVRRGWKMAKLPAVLSCNHIQRVGFDACANNVKISVEKLWIFTADRIFPVAPFPLALSANNTLKCVNSALFKICTSIWRFSLFSTNNFYLRCHGDSIILSSRVFHPFHTFFFNQRINGFFPNIKMDFRRKFLPKCIF